MLNPSENRSAGGAKLLGDLSALAEQLGSSAELMALTAVSASVQTGEIQTQSQLRAFLRDYQMRMLLTVELPVICQAFVHASRFEVRELIALDQGLAQQAALEDFARASQRVGCSQLKRLRPLRDQRLVQRYLRAVEGGEAHGWHTVVYALVLHVYSLPLCQGLACYAQQTVRGFIHAAATPIRLSDEQCRKLESETLMDLRQPLSSLLKSAAGPERPQLETGQGG
jgi:urease accessory protein UreF